MASTKAGGSAKTLLLLTSKYLGVKSLTARERVPAW